MLTLPTPTAGESLVSAVSRHLRDGTMPDYVYSYPPRQTFQSIPELADEQIVSKALTGSPDNLNLYLHFPFCSQICGFCNLFATIYRPGDAIESYLDSLIQEMRHYAAMLPRQRCRTLYFGGGTPSLLSLSQVERVLEEAERNFPGSWSETDELAMEVAPDTVTKDHMQGMVELGFTRVSLGVQSVHDRELAVLGRHASGHETKKAVATAIESGIKDVCVDLIIGLPAQSRSDWIQSVRSVVELRPSTICTYNLTLRPHTGFSRRRQQPTTDDERNVRYKLAQQAILKAGYEQETNVRYVIPGVGGYVQKVHHWNGATVLGFGAGARTYGTSLHFNNGYSARHRTAILNRYVECIAANGHARAEGFSLHPGEEFRRLVVLNLHKMETRWLEVSPSEEFAESLSSLVLFLLSEDYARPVPDGIRFTPKGFACRDIFSHALFSDEVRSLINVHDYAA